MQAITPPTTSGWITAMATRLTPLHSADEATVWAAIPTVFLDVMGVECDRDDGYHCALAEAVVDAVLSRLRGRLTDA
jgi:hypothetical protein